ncbi:MAG: 4-alpha-glucanotransferase [Oscillospiraceae bacterium]|nr:4-alpha-glucanotransferase [Oscillospiraceae bacterium]
MRQSGILMHITSLPGRYGVGTLGREAYGFVDFLERSGQSVWQLLPLTPTGYGDSPYQSCSAFAGNPYLIDIPSLVEAGLLTAEEPEMYAWGDDPEQVDFGLLYENRFALLKKAFDRFADHRALDAFCRKHADWLPDFALFMALKDKFSGSPWYSWDAPLKYRDPDALWEVRKELERPIRFYCFLQYLFYTQWEALRSYAHGKGIRFLGDVPIYVPLDSVEVWCSPELFQLDSQRNPRAVAGCPPDAFTEDGQLWGNPLYRWETHKKDGYHWWLRRLGFAMGLYDMVRLDHFRGFEAYWSVPYGDATAKNGKWEKGPGMDFFDTVKKKLPQLELIAEDLGLLTQDVFDLRDGAGLPGMRVLEFAFDSREPSIYLPHTYIQNTVCYTGTHDNMPLRQWLDTAPEATLTYAREYMRLSEGEGLVQGVIRTALGSVSKLCVIPMQDWLELGEKARMNFPGTMGKNWTWRTLPGSFSEGLADRIKAMTVLYGRCENKEY